MNYITKISISFLHPLFPLKKILKCGKQSKPKLTKDILLGRWQYQMCTPNGVIREIMTQHCMNIMFGCIIVDLNKISHKQTNYQNLREQTQYTAKFLIV